MSKLVQYLHSLPPDTSLELYASPWTSQAIFRTLPPLAKQYVLRLLYIDEAITADTLRSWASVDATAKHQHAVESLVQLRAFSLETSPTGVESYRLCQPLARSMKVALAQSETPPWEADLPSQDRAHAFHPSVQSLCFYARWSWDRILYFLVGQDPPPLPAATAGEEDTRTQNISYGLSRQSLNEVRKMVVSVSADPHDRFIEILIDIGLLMIEASNDSLTLTSSGFQFLLRDLHTQVWTVLLHYIEAVDTRQQTSVLAFLFYLSFLRLGDRYVVSALPEDQCNILPDLADLGLLYLQGSGRNGAPVYYYPTDIAISLVSSNAERGPFSEDSGYIVVESNYHLYAYTESPLQLALLKQFVNVRYRMANFAMGIITRTSVRAAMERGITAEQIIEFLNHHAHQKTSTRSPRVPEVVTDQIRLWEQEKFRVSMDRCVLYDKFSNENAYIKVKKYARDLGVLLWSSDARRAVSVKESAHDIVKKFISSSV
eukprot:TRINITY_DN5253_c0_g1_i1.p1 TRINITY_DN5253_c0_g1~~TRINITY_DN5253_c0_g1_i1.p1  ORF type:complete len:487 (-),score=71.72 TRINITY_DN5253_c0_g1_i1:124-1584(-)